MSARRDNKASRYRGSPLKVLRQNGALRLPKKSATLPGTVADYVMKASRYQSIGGVNKNDLRDAGFAFPFTVFYIGSVFIIFFSLLWNQVNLARNSKFLSLVDNDPSTVCREVPLSITETHAATVLGVWDTSPHFVRNQSYYQLMFNGAQMTSADYKESFSFFGKQLQSYGKYYAKKNLILKLIAMSILQYDRPGVSFTLSVGATHIFNGAINVATLSNKQGVCTGSADASITGKYDFSASSLQFNLPLYMDYSHYLANVYLPTSRLSPKLLSQAPCASHFGGKMIDYSAEWLNEYRDGHVSFKFDVRSFVAAIGRNLGAPTEGQYVQVESGNSLPGMIGYVDDYFTDFMPFWCIDKSNPMWNMTGDTGPDICFVSTVPSYNYPMNMLYYPVMTQLARTKTQGPKGGCTRRVVCKCDNYFALDIKQRDCYKNKFQLGLIYGTSSHVQFGDDDSDVVAWEIMQIFELAKRIQNMVVSSGENGDMTAFEYVSDMLGYSICIDHATDLANETISSFHDDEGNFYNNSWARGKSYSQLLADEWEKLCENCSALVFEVGGSTTLNTFDLQLQQIPLLSPDEPIACQDIFSQPAAVAALASQPPVPLVNSYYQCEKTLSAAFFSTVGSVIASTNFLALLLWVVGGYFMVWVVKAHLQNCGELLLSTSQKASLGDAFDNVKNESLLAHLQKATEEIKLLSNKVDHLESQLRRIDKSGDLIPTAESGPLDGDLQDTLDQVTNVYRLEDALFVGARVSAVLVAADSAKVGEDAMGNDDFDRESALEMANFREKMVTQPCTNPMTADVGEKPARSRIQV